MSLVMAWTDGEVAHMVSDGLVFDGKKVFARDRRKFFETPLGLVIGSAGFLRNVESVERDFADSRLDFFPTVRALERRVAAAYADVNGGFGLPLGILVVGSDGKQIRIANTGREGTTISTPGTSFVSYLAAGDGADDSLLRRILSCAHGQPDVKDFLIRDIGFFAERLPDQIGGEIFSASLPRPPGESPAVIRISDANAERPRVSSSLNNQASITGNPNASVSYTSTSSSITWSWGAFSVYFPDGTSISVSAGSQSFTGLASVSTYFFDFYVVKATGVMVCVMSDNSTAPSSTQFLSQTVAADGHAVEITDITGATVASGGSGGGAGTGGTCFSGDTKIKTDSGFVRMDELPEEFTVENRTGRHRAQLIVHEASESPMRVMPDGCLVTEEHLFEISDGKWVAARDIFAEQAPQAVRTVYNVHVLTENPDDMHYILESGHVAHNKKKLCFSAETRVLTDEGYARMDSLPEEFRIVNRDGAFRAHLIRHEDCKDAMCVLPCGGGLVSKIHLLRGHQDKTWRQAEDVLREASDQPSTLYNIHVEGSDFFELACGLEANDMKGAQ